MPIVLDVFPVLLPLTGVVLNYLYIFLHLAFNNLLFFEHSTEIFFLIYNVTFVQLIFMFYNSQPLVDVFLHHFFFPFDSVRRGIILIHLSILFSRYNLTTKAAHVCNAETTFFSAYRKRRHSLIQFQTFWLAIVHKILHYEGQFRKPCSLEEFECSLSIFLIINFLFFLKLRQGPS